MRRSSEARNTLEIGHGQLAGASRVRHGRPAPRWLGRQREADSVTIEVALHTENRFNWLIRIR